MRYLLFCVALTACGGIIDTGDGGNNGGGDSGGGGSDGASKKDVITIDVTGSNCSPIQTETAIDSNGGCQSSASWSCGDTKYTAQCNCPSAQCTCTSQSGSTGTGFTANEPSFCPACNAAELPKICGFPTN